MTAAIRPLADYGRICYRLTQRSLNPRERGSSHSFPVDVRFGEKAKWSMFVSLVPCEVRVVGERAIYRNWSTARL